MKKGFIKKFVCLFSMLTLFFVSTALETTAGYRFASREEVSKRAKFDDVNEGINVQFFFETTFGDKYGFDTLWNCVFSCFIFDPLNLDLKGSFLELKARNLINIPLKFVPILYNVAINLELYKGSYCKEFEEIIESVKKMSKKIAVCYGFSLYEDIWVTKENEDLDLDLELDPPQFLVEDQGQCPVWNHYKSRIQKIKNASTRLLGELRYGKNWKSYIPPDKNLKI